VKSKFSQDKIEFMAPNMFIALNMHHSRTLKEYLQWCSEATNARRYLCDVMY